MPMYDYRCVDCGSHNERHAEVDNRDLVWYCWCGGKMLRRPSLIGGVYIR